MVGMTLIEATQTGLAEEMRRDPNVWVLGEDVREGGVYFQYLGFVDEFGGERVVSTPISEGMIMNVGLGAAITGTRPVVEIRIADFILCAMDELINQVAKIRYMFGGQTQVPLVVRLPCGLSGYSAAQHSQSHEAWFVHTPGLVVVAPATATDAKGLMKAAVRCDDPVVFFEPRSLWGTSEEVPADDSTVPIGEARLARRGTDATLVTWSDDLARGPFRGAVGERRGNIGGSRGLAHAVALGHEYCPDVGAPHRQAPGRPRSCEGRWTRGRNLCRRRRDAGRGSQEPRRPCRRPADSGPLLAATRERL